MSIFDAVMGELHDRNMYKADLYAPFFISSFAMHCFNLYNQSSNVYWDSGMLPNMRGHILFVAPPGGMKSHFMSTMATSTFGMFKNGGVTIGAEQSMTGAALVGSFGEGGVEKQGAAEIYKEGIMVVDEFYAIIAAMQATHSSDMSTNLLTALDSGNMNKRLVAGKIDYTTHMTLWAGTQPAKFDASGGLARRLQFLNYSPTKYDNERLLEIQAENRNRAPNIHYMDGLWAKMRKFKEDMRHVEKITFDDSVLKKYKELELYSFEGNYFDRLLFGYQLAMHGPEKHIHVSFDDNLLKDMVTTQKRWRREIADGIDYVQLVKLIEAGN